MMPAYFVSVLEISVVDVLRLVLAMALVAYVRIAVGVVLVATEHVKER